MIFVDTNYFLRYLLKDNLNQYLVAKEVFDKAALGQIRLFTSALVIFELYWVFTKFYKKTEKEVLIIIGEIIALGSVEIEHKTIFRRAIILAQSYKLGLQDTFNLVYSQDKDAKDFKTFDIKLSKALKKKI